MSKCIWCLKRIANSDWEQKTLKRGWKRLCKPCARRRLNNPFNALLEMRKIQALEKDDE